MDNRAVMKNAQLTGGVARLGVLLWAPELLHELPENPFEIALHHATCSVSQNVADRRIPHDRDDFELLEDVVGEHDRDGLGGLGVSPIRRSTLCVT